MTTTLALHCGRNVLSNRDRMVTLCESGESWQNHSGTFRGGPADGGTTLPRDHQLPPQWVTEWDYHLHTVGITYVVWSYDTPIMWRTGDGTWVKPPVTYSNTTTRHQGNLYRFAGEVTDRLSHPLYRR